MEEIQTDVEILLECVKCQLSQPDSLKSSLGTLASVLTANDAAKESFRDLGGLKYVLNLILQTKHLSVKQSGMFCLACAVEKSVFSQKSLSQQSTFVFIHKILSDASSSSRIKQTSVFFLLCIVANNGLGQNLARQTGCLAVLIEMCKGLIKENQSGLTPGNSWSFVNSAISVCVNNPQNEENQHLTSMLFPHLFKLIQENLNPELLKPALSLLGLAVANNVLNQDRVRRCGGLDTLVTALGKCLGYSILDEPGLAIPIINTVDSCIADHETNCKTFGELGGISLLLNILRQPDLDQQENLQVVLTLGHALDTSAENQSCIDRRGYQTLVKHLTEAQDEELIKALKYTLNLCQKEGQMNHNVENTERQQGDIILEKISQLTAKLNSFEEESRQDSKLLSDLVENQNKITKAEEPSSKSHLQEEAKSIPKKPEQPSLSRTESLLQQLISMFQSSKTQQKSYSTSSDVNENWQADQYTPVKRIQTNIQSPNIPTYEQMPLRSTEVVDETTRMALVGSTTQDSSQSLHFEFAPRKNTYLKDLEISQQLQSFTSNPDLSSTRNHLHDTEKRTHGTPNMSKKAHKAYFCRIEGNSNENCHIQHNKISHIISSNDYHPLRNSHNSNVNNVNSDMYNQNRGITLKKSDGSANNMLGCHSVSGDDIQSLSNTKDTHLTNRSIVCQDGMHNSNVFSSIHPAKHTESCKCDGNDIQFHNSNESCYVRNKIVCQNVNENNVGYNNPSGNRSDICTNHICCKLGANHNFHEADDVPCNLSVNMYKMSTNHIDEVECQAHLTEKPTHAGHSQNRVQYGQSQLETQNMDMRSNNQNWVQYEPSNCEAQNMDIRSNKQNWVQYGHSNCEAQNIDMRSNKENRVHYEPSKCEAQNMDMRSNKENQVQYEHSNSKTQNMGIGSNNQNQLQYEHSTYQAQNKDMRSNIQDHVQNGLFECEAQNVDMRRNNQNQLQNGHSKHTQNMDIGSSNQCSTCQTGHSIQQATTDHAGQITSKNSSYSPGKINQTEQCKNTPHSLINMFHLCNDDDCQCKPSTFKRTIVPKNTTEAFHNYSVSNIPIQRVESNSALQEKGNEDELTDKSVSVIEFSNDVNADSTIFCPINYNGSSADSSNKMLASFKKTKSFTPQTRGDYEKVRCNSDNTSHTNCVNQRIDIPTNKDEIQSEQESTPDPKQRNRLKETSSYNSESLNTRHIMTDKFVKPIAAPLRRKIITPSSCGSGTSTGGRRNNVRLFSKKSTVGIQEKPITIDEVGRRRAIDSPFRQKQHTVKPLASPATSEFDFGLLTSAKRNLWTSDKLCRSCTPVLQNLSVNKFRSFTDARHIRKPTVNPAYSRPVSEMCLKHSDSESFSSDESDEGSQTSTADSEMNSECTSNTLQSKERKNLLCPGCNSSEQIGGSTLNSRTFNITLETSTNTCSSHRNIRRLERNFIQKTKESRYAALTSSQKRRPLRANIKEWISKQEINVHQQKKTQNVYDFPGSSSDSEPSSKEYTG
ncbi:putative uncharacterized protein DDB_G0282133 isoform X2 [Gigantopelta aegis]|uniref:putative uncharacterized protein DDB_G0282133 isoform X2 n=1 Tax=Gigantopelta aegis TaxID=1735272 RepID=UPI001B888761|nr:putative uncharacterized protein DDB_G0282133 isoform X2 [Gigantopelta aegis]